MGDSGYLILFVILIFIACFSQIRNEIYFDEGLFETVGYYMSHGHVLYHDLADTKPPLLYLLGYLNSILFGDSLIAPRFFMSVVTALTVIPLSLICKGYFSRTTAYLASLLYLTSILTKSFGYEMHPDSLLSFFGLWSVYLLFTGLGGGRYWRILLAGVSLGLMGATKQSAVFLLLVSVSYLLAARKNVLTSLVLFSTGLAIVSAAFLIYLASNGSLHDALYYVIMFGPEHMGGGSVNVLSSMPGRIVVLFTIAFINPLAYSGAVYAVPRIIKSGSQEKRFILTWFIIEAMDLLFVYPHLFPTHFILLTFLSYILAPDALPTFIVYLKRLHKRTNWLFKGLIVYTAGFFLLIQISGLLSNPSDNNAITLEDNTFVGSYLNETIPENQTLLILANPIYYVLSGRNPPAAFMNTSIVPYFDHFTYVFVYANDTELQTFSNQIETTKVDYILVERGQVIMPDPLGEVNSVYKYSSLNEVFKRYDTYSEINFRHKGKTKQFYLLKLRQD